ncbi:MAG: GntR family transcriptional regulator [Clostridiales bacterium]|jgi:GntR family transcriptional regulator|nr:GntR family transcriptional regulator [Clostridiales bacterium]
MFSIDIMSRQPIYEQIIEQLERYILSDLLKPGDQLPSVREMSVRLSINPNTIQKAYSELDHRGILCSVPGRGCFISENAVPILSEMRRKDIEKLEDLVYNLALAGVEKEKTISIVEKAYENIRGQSTNGKDGNHDKG